MIDGILSYHIYLLHTSRCKTGNSCKNKAQLTIEFEEKLHCCTAAEANSLTKLAALKRRLVHPLPTNHNQSQLANKLYPNLHRKSTSTFTD